ncbi:alpha/beta hydrolase [Glaciecola sp. MH2013]|uniref:alpha/beta fold hydrolase n=1 Tax=Glaciecola sp. MH2013 TaxID=2785524 RepID=UPI00189EEDCD|nr:alpha/beta hydrolase [Glaciecola sp. MH2013]MBF7072820.1 alpha/beta hydrolase [Glaciecola sp. MH2013]
MYLVVGSLSVVFVVVVCFVALKLDTTFTIANSFYNAANAIEAKLAKLKIYRSFNENFGVSTHYLSNVSSFDNTKPVVVLLHGFSADKYIWNRISLRLAKHYQLFIPDLLGHGDTEYNQEQNYSTKRQCEFLVEFLASVEIDRFHIIGNSMGGLMTAQLLEMMPERIIKAVLIDPAGVRSDFSLQMAKTNQNPFNHYNEEDFFYFYDLVMAKPPYMPKFILRALAHKYISRREQYVHMFRDFFNPDDFYEQDKHKIGGCKTMLIWGVNDKLMPVDDYMIWQNMLDSETVIYEDLGHMPMVEDVRRVSRDIITFLSN